MKQTIFNYGNEYLLVQAKDLELINMEPKPKIKGNDDDKNWLIIKDQKLMEKINSYEWIIDYDEMASKSEEELIAIKSQFDQKLRNKIKKSVYLYEYIYNYENIVRKQNLEKDIYELIWTRREEKVNTKARNIYKKLLTCFGGAILLSASFLNISLEYDFQLNESTLLYVIGSVTFFGDAYWKEMVEEHDPKLPNKIRKIK